MWWRNGDKRWALGKLHINKLTSLLTDVTLDQRSHAIPAASAANPPHEHKGSTKFIEDLTEDDKGQWIELNDGELKNQMSGLMDYMYDKEIDNVDWDSLNFITYGSDYYED